MDLDFDDEWDAADLACGPLLLGLRKRLVAMPGRVLKLRSQDPGAPEDIPAFCRMTGHALVHAAREDYWIRAK